MDTTPGRLRRIPALLLAGLLGAACGGDGDGDPTPKPNTEANAVAAAGDALQTTRGFTVTLDGRDSSDPEGSALTYRWTQLFGPDVTGLTGELTGVRPSFEAPDEVCTLVFDLRVDDGNGESAPSRVQIDVLEGAGGVWVDGDAGDDATGDGTRAAPYATLGKALEVAGASTDPLDVYVRSRTADAPYVESAALVVPTGTSLYGGFGEGWVRRLPTHCAERHPQAGCGIFPLAPCCHANPSFAPVGRTVISGASTAVSFAGVDLDAALSGFAVSAANSAGPGTSVFALRADGGTATLTVDDCLLDAGDVGFGQSATPGSSYGAAIVGIASALVSDSTIVAGDGGDGVQGANGVPFYDDASRATDGAPGSSGGGGGAGGPPTAAAREVTAAPGATSTARRASPEAATPPATAWAARGVAAATTPSSAP